MRKISKRFYLSTFFGIGINKEITRIQDKFENHPGNNRENLRKPPPYAGLEAVFSIGYYFNPLREYPKKNRKSSATPQINEQ
ncbi:MAG TPA: hypothetical protein DCD96_02405 [Flavobacteriales bacterium]|nr:hypothetical protein [Flavobacteriales bacterium]